MESNSKLNKIKSIAVFCGASEGKNSIYLAAANDVGRILGSKGISIIYGGAKIGMMGAVANSALNAGGKVTGVIPYFLSDKEVKHSELTEMIAVETMHERKEIMYSKSDAIIVLPGGFGTMDELFEVLTWAQLGLHTKPIGIFNINGYYNSLIQMMHIMNSEGFLPDEAFRLIVVRSDVEKLLQSLSNFVAPNLNKYLNEDQI